jgi:hypothetical protein
MTDNNTITILDGNYSLTLSSIAIKGFDSFTKVSLLEPSLSSNISLNTMIQFDTLEVTVYSSFQSTDSNWYLKDYKEQLEFKLLLSDITMILDVAVGVIKKDFSSLYVDQLFHLDCLLSSGLKYLNITSLIVDVGVNNVEIVRKDRTNPFKKMIYHFKKEEVSSDDDTIFIGIPAYRDP